MEYGSITEEIAKKLEMLVKAKYNIFISGGTGSGKTTFLNALSNYIPKDERVITIEDSAELQITGVENLVSLIDLPPTLLSLAGIPIPDSYSGNILPVNRDDTPERDCVFIQISESQIGRAVRTKDWKYSARAIGSGMLQHSASVYFDDFLYDLKSDPYEKNNLVNNKEYKHVIKEMREILSREMVKAGERKPLFLKPLIKNKN